MTLTSTKYQNRNRNHIRGATGAFGRGGSFRAGCKYLASLARHCGLVSPGWVTQASRKGAASNTDVSPIRRATSSTLPEPSLTYCKILRASYSVPDLSSFNSSSALSSSAFNSELLRRAAENRVSPSSVEYEQSESLTRHLEQAGRSPSHFAFFLRHLKHADWIWPRLILARGCLNNARILARAFLVLCCWNTVWGRGLLRSPADPSQSGLMFCSKVRSTRWVESGWTARALLVTGHGHYWKCGSYINRSGRPRVAVRLMRQFDANWRFRSLVLTPTHRNCSPTV